MGGNFTSAGGTSLASIGNWNGTVWNSLQGGTDGEVRALRVRSGLIYAGGDFTRAGDKMARSVAIWDGQSWRFQERLSSW